MPKDEFDHEDPLELVGTAMPDPDGTSLDEMARCLVEEYVRMGWDDRRLWTLFRNPFFGVTHSIYCQKGEDYVRDLIASVREQWGYWNVKREA
ncbi:MAG: hypothetical protein ACE5LU_11535 [Anaerolineae bacterium]